MNPINLKELFNSAVAHRNSHDCSAYPYEHGEKLIQTIQDIKAKSILEIGTGMGYTAALMALSAPEISVLTIEKDPEHAEIARAFAKDKGVDTQITVINESAETFLSTLDERYDLIFFDGYQVHYEFLPHYERLLKPEGILFLANNHLKSRTSDKFFEELSDKGKWRLLKQFADTTIAQRLA